MGGCEGNIRNRTICSKKKLRVIIIEQYGLDVLKDYEFGRKAYQKYGSYYFSLDRQIKRMIKEGKQLPENIMKNLILLNNQVLNNQNDLNQSKASTNISSFALESKNSNKRKGNKNSTAFDVNQPVEENVVSFDIEDSIDLFKESFRKTGLTSGTLFLEGYIKSTFDVSNFLKKTHGKMEIVEFITLDTDKLELQQELFYKYKPKNKQERKLIEGKMEKMYNDIERLKKYFSTKSVFLKEIYIPTERQMNDNKYRKNLYNELIDEINDNCFFVQPVINNITYSPNDYNISLTLSPLETNYNISLFGDESKKYLAETNCFLLIDSLFEIPYTTQNIKFSNINSGFHEIKIRFTTQLTTMEGLFKNSRYTKIADFYKFVAEDVESMENLFNGCGELVKIKHMKNLRSSNLENISSMFAGCKKIETIDLFDLNLSNVKYINELFYDCSNLKTINVSCLSSSPLVKIDDMFGSCSALTEIIGLDSLDLSNVEKIRGEFFLCCTHLRHIDFHPTSNNEILYKVILSNFPFLLEEKKDDYE